MRLIWINGPFGVGKSSAAERVAAALGGIEFDPERLGGVLRALVVPTPDDFQSLVCWQLATVGALSGLISDMPDRPLVMAMTVYRPDVRRVLREGIISTGVPTLEVVLTADEATIRRRLNSRARGPLYPVRRRSRDWALTRAGEAIRAFRLDGGDVLLDTTSLSPGEVSEAILEQVGRLER